MTPPPPAFIQSSSRATCILYVANTALRPRAGGGSGCPTRIPTRPVLRGRPRAPRQSLARPRLRKWNESRVVVSGGTKRRRPRRAVLQRVDHSCVCTALTYIYPPASRMTPLRPGLCHSNRYVSISGTGVPNSHQIPRRRGTRAPRPRPRRCTLGRTTPTRTAPPIHK